MAGWSHKLGFVVPSWNTVIEYETARLLPAGVSMHVTRISHTSDSLASIDHMIERTPEHLTLLAHAGVDAISFACTAAGFAHGLSHDRAHLARWSEQAGRPVISTAGAFIEAAASLGLKRLAIAAPYERWVMDRLAAYLAEGGFEIVGSRGLGHEASILYGPEKAMELARSVWTEEADGLVLSCSNFRTLEAIDDIERLIGRPVVTSNTAALWALLRQRGWPSPIEGGGRLLRSLGQ